MMPITNDFPRPNQQRRARSVLVAVAAVVLVAFSLVVGVKAYHGELAAATAVPADAALSSGAPLAGVSGVGPDALSQAFSSVAKAVGPAVVHINVVQEVKRPPMPQFFGFEPGEGGMQKERGSGSGVIVNANGYILTNNHVVGKASSIEVKLADGRRLKGTVVGTDPQTDLAVVKIDAASLPIANLGDSDALQQGEWVVAVGSPFGLEQTITAGIVSATGRRLTASPYDAFIQTDASINPGNSGGPLVNLHGEVVGINTLIFSESGGNQGIGFAIPASMARKVYEQLVSGNHKVVRGYLGVNVSDLTPALAQSLNAPDGTKGAVIADVAGDSAPAAKAGLKSGDVIVAVDGRPVTSGQDLTSMVADITPGTTVKVDYLRDGKSESTHVSVADRPANAGIPGAEQDDDNGSNGGASREKLGVSVSDVNAEIADQLKLKIPSGAVITSVDPGSAAAEAGLQRGDVIHRFGRSQITSARDLSAAITAANGQSQIVVQVERNGRLAFVTIELN